VNLTRGRLDLRDYLPVPEWLVEDKEVKTFHLDLPLPPSLNNMYRNVYSKGRVKSDTYNAWQLEAGYGAAFPQGWEGFAGIVLLYVDCGALGRGRDVDNCIKPVQDLCAKMLGVNDACFRFCAAFESDSHGIQKGRVGVTLVMVEG
jgi:Holliday junction resolvase RusA-like endonuclease